MQSIEVGLRLLEALCGAAGPMALKDLATAAGMPPSKAHRYLVSLARGGLVEQDRLSGRYDFGVLALRLGLAALNRLDVVRLASRALPGLVEELGESAFLAVWGNRGPTIIRWEEGDRPVTVNVRIGSVMPLLTSATGRVFLAFLPRGATRPILAAERALQRGLDPRQLVAEVRAHCLARVDGDLVPGVAALSAPIFDHTGGLVAALTVLGAGPRFDASRDGRLARGLRAAAAALSARLGGSS